MLEPLVIEGKQVYGIKREIKTTGDSFFWNTDRMSSNMNGTGMIVDSIFDQATEDVSTLYWALDSWPGEDEGYTPGYLFIQAIAGYSRSQQALTCLGSIVLPPDLLPYRMRLEELLREGEEKLEKFIPQNRKELEDLFASSGELSQRLNDADRMLARFRDAFLDSEFFDTGGLVSEDLLDYGHEFLLVFSDLQRVAVVDLQVLRGLPSYDQWAAGFSRLEGLFRRYFGYFEPIPDLIKVIRDREYGADWWWLTETARAEEVQEPELSDTWLLSLEETFAKASERTCPEPGLVISYASGELTGEERLEIEQHVDQCVTCLDLVLDTQWAVAPEKPETLANESAQVREMARTVLGILLAYRSYRTFYQRIRSLAPDLKVPRMGSLFEMVSNLLRAEWEPNALPMKAKTEDTKVLAGKKVEIASGLITALHPLEITLTHDDFEAGRLTLSGRILVQEPLSHETTLICTWITPHGEILWPKADRVHLDTNRAYFVVTFDVAEKPEGKPSFLILTGS